MTELIKVKPSRFGSSNINSVDARQLHCFLGSKQEFANWIKNRISEYDFLQGVDFLINLSKTPNGGRPQSQYTISLEMAKELSMVERNDKGKQARKFFIDCEKRLKNLLPQNFSEALRLAADQAEQIEQLEHQKQIDAPKVEFANTIAGSKDTIKIGEFAKLTGKIGPKKIFELFRARKILMSDNLPYQMYVNAGYFKVTERLINGKKIKFTTYITGKGQVWAAERLDGWIEKQNPAPPGS